MILTRKSTVNNLKVANDIINMQNKKISEMEQENVRMTILLRKVLGASVTPMSKSRYEYLEAVRSEIEKELNA